MKRRNVAIIIVTLAVLLATGLGFRVTLGRKARGVNTAYTQGDNGGKGPGAYAAAVDECAANLVKIGERYPQAAAETKALSAVRQERAAQAGRPAQEAALLSRYGEAAERLEEKLSQLPLTELDEAELSKYLLRLQDGITKARLAAGDYNEKAASYNELLRAFPVNLFYRLLGLKEAELFQ